LLKSAADTWGPPADKVPRLELFATWRVLISVYDSSRRQRKAIDVALNALKCIGFVLRGASLPLEPGVDFEIVKYGIPFHGVLQIWICLWQIYRKLRASELSEKAYASARTAYLIHFGEDATFRVNLEILGMKIDVGIFLLEDIFCLNTTAPDTYIINLDVSGV